MEFISVHLARLGPTISQGSFRRRIFTSKRPSRQSRPIKFIHSGTAECNKRVRIAKQTRPTFADIQHRPRLWGIKFQYFSIHLARLGPNISQGWFRRRIFISKRPSRQSRPIKFIHSGTAECNKSVRIAKQTGPTFADIQHRPRLCSGLLRSASLDPPRRGNFHFVRSTLLYDD